MTDLDGICNSEHFFTVPTQNAHDIIFCGVLFCIFVNILYWNYLYIIDVLHVL